MDDNSLVPNRENATPDGDASDWITILRSSLLSASRVNEAVLERVETACKLLSLVSSFKQGDAGIIACETFTSVANLTGYARHLLVQRAVETSGGKILHRGDERRFLLAAITVCNQLQCLVEMCARRFISDRAKWISIILILSVKLLCHAVLLLKHRARLFCTVKPKAAQAQRATGPFSTSKLRVVECTAPRTQAQSNTRESTSSTLWNLSTADRSALPNPDGVDSPYLRLRSGRLIRSVFGNAGGAAPLSRGDEPARISSSDATRPSTSASSSTNLLDNCLRIAEALRLLRPFVHLLAVRSFGESSWLAWLVALLCDSVSAALISDQAEHLDEAERVELRRRLATLWFYALRPPLFERTVRRLIDVIARALKAMLPFGIGASAVDALVQQLDFWQTVYTYCWDV